MRVCVLHFALLSTKPTVQRRLRKDYGVSDMENTNTHTHKQRGLNVLLCHTVSLLPFSLALGNSFGPFCERKTLFPTTICIPRVRRTAVRPFFLLLLLFFTPHNYHQRLFACKTQDAHAHTRTSRCVLRWSSASRGGRKLFFLDFEILFARYRDTLFSNVTA